MIHFDTSFVVDFLREAAQGTVGPARTLFRTLPSPPHTLSVFAQCELFAGIAQASRNAEERGRVEHFCAHLRLLYPQEGFAEAYGQLIASLKRLGRTPQVMDALIATLAIQDEARLVTRDRAAFAGVPGLVVITY